MKKITFTNTHQKKHFEFFKAMNHPHFNVTANVDITDFLNWLQKTGERFTPAVVYALARAANEVKQLRWRIRGEEVVEHELVHPSFTVKTDASEVFSFCEVAFAYERDDFMSRAAATIERMKTNPSFEDNRYEDAYLFMSSFPWVSFTSISHAMNYHPHDSVPRITWGKYFVQNERTLMPVAIQAHHALVDGSHIGQFFQYLEIILKRD